MARIRVETIHGPARREIAKGLRAFKACHFGTLDYKPLTITLREGKEIVGGLTGETALGWLYIDLLGLRRAAARGLGKGADGKGGS